MRPLPLAISVCSMLAIGLSLAGSFRSRAARPTVSIERGALPVPPPMEAEPAGARPATTPAKPSTRGPLRDRPALAAAHRFPPPDPRREGWVIETSGVPYLPPVIPPGSGVRPAAPSPASPAAAAAPTQPAPSSSAPDINRGVEACAECGARAERSVTRGSVTVWFCEPHFNPPGRPPSDSTPPHEEPEIAGAGARATPSAGAPAATQCVGMTRSGARCRRKTLDTSGLCHQHRAKK